MTFLNACLVLYSNGTISTLARYCSLLFIFWTEFFFFPNFFLRLCLFFMIWFLWRNLTFERVFFLSSTNFFHCPHLIAVVLHNFSQIRVRITWRRFRKLSNALPPPFLCIAEYLHLYVCWLSGERGWAGCLGWMSDQKEGGQAKGNTKKKENSRRKTNRKVKYNKQMEDGNEKKRIACVWYVYNKVVQVLPHTDWCSILHPPLFFLSLFFLLWAPSGGRSALTRWW